MLEYAFLFPTIVAIVCQTFTQGNISLYSPLAPQTLITRARIYGEQKHLILPY